MSARYSADDYAGAARKLMPTLGFTITITNYAPLRAGHFNAGDAAYGLAWADAWGIHVVANSGGLPTTALKAEIDAIRPAETTTLLV